jgi:hypothetical protein
VQRKTETAPVQTSRHEIMIVSARLLNLMREGKTCDNPSAKAQAQATQHEHSAN